MNNSKLISKEVNGLETVYTLVPGTKLSEVMDELPHGIINKNYTGIGGTTLELDCNRNSIVVEPLKETAWTKAQKPSLDNKYKIFYFGSKSFVQTRVSRKISTLSTKELKFEELSKNLNEYIQDCLKQEKPIKICTVTDQLQTLYNLLETAHPELYSTFHLLLDEVDYMQEASSFRKVMHDCMDIFKEHSPLQRSLLSATIKKFHDPIIAEEPVTTIKYQDHKKTKLDVYESTLTEEAILELVTKRLVDSPNEKIVVALNQLKSCIRVAQQLVKQNAIEQSEIAILCSQSRVSEVQEYKHEISSIGILPCTLTFLTSAYFVGYDIDERYHNIVACDGNSPSLAIHPSTVYQVSGRCRAKAGLYSNSLLHRMVYSNTQEQKTYSAQELINNSDIANGISALIKLVDQKKTEYARRFKNHLSKSIFNTDDFYLNIFKPSTTGSDTAEISYLKIDEIIQNQGTKALCADADEYSKSLEDWFNITRHKLHVEPSEVDCNNIKDALTHALNQIKELSNYAAPQDYFPQILNSINTTKPIKGSIKKLLELYNFSSAHLLFDRDKVLNAVEGIISNEKQPSSRIEELNLYLQFEKLKSLGNSTAVTSIELAYSINTSSPSSDLMSINKKLANSLKKGDKNSKLEKQFVNSITKNKNIEKKLHLLFVNSTSKSSNSVKTYTFTTGEKYDVLS